MRTPNQEQKLAIEHNGGIALSAGAGSGKTFVLVEHLIYRWGNLLDSPEKLIASMKSTALMTFTIKAAGEIKSRLLARVDSMALQNPQWVTVKNELENVFVGTIHSFYMHAITVISPAVGRLNILSNEDYRAKIEAILGNWIQSQDKDDEIIQWIVADFTQMVDTFNAIYSDAYLRSLWRQFSHDRNDLPWADHFWNDLNIVLLPQKIISHEQLSNELPNENWRTFILELYKLPVEFKSTNDLLAYYQLFQSIPKVRPPAKKVSSTVNQLIDELKILQTVFNRKEIFEDLLEGGVHSNQWRNIYREMFNEIEQKYELIPGHCYADSESILTSLLEDANNRNIIQRKFDYFVIDEFQDTSLIQYSIFRKLINDDYQRAFFIGDIKQSIYGFRGGELGVFLDAKSRCRNLDLAMNYRSESQVVHFNNSLFSYLFPLADDWSPDSVDRHASPYASQTPVVERNSGVVGMIKGILPSTEGEIDSGNAETDLITKYVLQSDSEEIAILARTNKTLTEQAISFLKHDISFNIYLKIPTMDDPINALFYGLISCLDEESNYSHFILDGICRSFNLSLESKDIFSMFKKSNNDIGLYYSFLQVIQYFGIKFSNLGMSLSDLKNVIHKYGDNPSLLKLKMAENAEFVTRPVSFGAKASRITLMTVHASKGLEFSEIILSGIWNRSRGNQGVTRIGNMPGSFSWRNNDNKKFIPTLEMLLENEIEKQKSHSESKRLFYVACTRAKKRLIFPSIPGQDPSKGKCWGVGLTSWLDHTNGTLKDYWTSEIATFDLDNNLCPQVPLHLRLRKLVSEVKNPAFFITPDLSVTRLAEIKNCPRKYYYQSILKWDDQAEAQVNIDGINNGSTGIRSSSDRGILYHKMLEEYLLGTSLPGRYKEKLNFVTDELDQKINEGWKLSPELQLRFDFWGHMISGVLDLVLEKDGSLEIWDYKTGQLDTEKEKSYWMQLCCYAFGCYILNKTDKKNQIILKLILLDENRIVSKMVDWDEVATLTKELKDLSQQFDQVNLNHCNQCQFREVCDHSLVSP